MSARRTTSATRIFEALRAEIVSMRLLPGAPILDRALVERFGVSRTPVREALIRLAEIGLVDVRPQAGTSVARIPVRAVREAALVRAALEDVTARLAAERTAAAGPVPYPLRTALALQHLAAAEGDAEGFHAGDEAFHAAIADAAGHGGIWTLVTQVKVQIDRARRLTLPEPGRMAQVIAEHEAILARIAAGDAAGASEAMARHLGVFAPDLADLCERHPAYFVADG